MSRASEQAVLDHLRSGLRCEIDMRGADAGRVFVPANEKFGELHLDEDVAEQDDWSALMARLEKEGIAELLEKGERVKLTGQATEILPQAR